MERLRLSLEGADLSSADLQGAGQRVDGDIIEIVDARNPAAPKPARADLERVPAAGAVHRKRRTGDSRRGAAAR